MTAVAVVDMADSSVILLVKKKFSIWFARDPAGSVLSRAEGNPSDWTIHHSPTQ